MLSGVLFPVDLRRHPQSLRRLAAALPEALRPLPGSAAGGRAATLAADFWREELRGCSATSARSPGAPPTDADLRESIALYNEARGRHPRAVPRCAGTAVERADRGALPAPARRRESCPPRSSSPSARALSRRRRGRAGPRRATAPRHHRRRVLRTASARPHQDDRARGLFHRRRRLPARQPVARRRRARSTAIRCATWPRRSCSTPCATRSLYEPDPSGKRRLVRERAADARADGVIFAARELLRSGAARPADAARRRRGGRASPASPSSSPRTPASSSSSASRPARSPTRSSSGGRAMSRSRKGPFDGAPEGDARGALPPPRGGAGDGRAGRLHLRAGQPDRADPLVRRAAGAARDQRAAVGACAARARRLHRRGGEGGPFGGRLLVRQVRHRNDEGRATSARPGRGCRSPTCCCSPTPAATRS